MQIDPAVEQSARKLLGHAMRAELEDAARLASSFSDAQFQQVLELCVATAGYVVIDVCGMEWPTEANLRKIAKNVAEAGTKLDLDPEAVFAFLSRVVLHAEPLREVFMAEQDAAMVPLLITSRILVVYCPQGRDQWDYLDEIEDALEVASSLKPSVYPAVFLRARRAVDERNR